MDGRLGRERVVVLVHIVRGGGEMWETNCVFYVGFDIVLFLSYIMIPRYVHSQPVLSPPLFPLLGNIYFLSPPPLSI